MPQRIIRGSKEIAGQIRSRRKELGLTIEEAASRAGVGTKTWCRYEAGESIRREKSRGICKALNWQSLPFGEEPNASVSLEECRSYGSWSGYLEEKYGENAAASFAAGSGFLRDHITEDMNALSSMPRGTHLGQLNVSMIRELLPEQFLVFYDYDFLYRLKCALTEMTKKAQAGEIMTANSVLQELVLFLCCREAATFMKLSTHTEGMEDETEEDWLYELFGDMDLITFLYSGQYLHPDHPFHFAHWDDVQFHVPSSEPRAGLASLFY